MSDEAEIIKGAESVQRTPVSRYWEEGGWETGEGRLWCWDWGNGGDCGAGIGAMGELSGPFERHVSRREESSERSALLLESWGKSGEKGGKALQVSVGKPYKEFCCKGKKE